MTVLSDRDIAAVAAQAGWRGNDLYTAIAVALAESGGDDHNHNPIPPDDSYGLWQINMLGSMGPSRRAQFNLKSNDDLYDPKTNARVAKAIQGSSGWSAWTTYTSKKYTEFTNRAKIAVDQTDMNNLLTATIGAGTTAAVQGTVAGLQNSAQLFTQIGNAFTWLATPANWLRVIEVGLGAALLIGGMYALSKPLIQPVVSDARSAVKTGMNFFPQGRVVNAAMKATGK
jgi:hypothetical protein